MGASVRIAWDANPESNIAGYRIYYGRDDTRELMDVIDVGNQTFGLVTDLTQGTAYFFYVTAYNTFQLESDPSALLTYTPLSLSMDPHLIVLTPSDVTLRPKLVGDRVPGGNLVISWQQLGGPEWLTVAGLTTLTPTVQARTPGYYTLQLTVTEGTTTHRATTTLRALSSSGQPVGQEPIALSYYYVFPDGLWLSWNSVPGASYLIGRKLEAGDRFWVSETEAIPIVSGGSLTDFVIGMEELELIERGFFTVFCIP